MLLLFRKEFTQLSLITPRLGKYNFCAFRSRIRLWILAYSDGERKPQPQGTEREFGEWTQHVREGTLWGEDPAEGTTQPRMGRVADGVPYRVDKIKGLGNAQVPMQAAYAWRLLVNDMGGDQ